MRKISVLYVDDDEFDILWLERISKKYSNVQVISKNDFGVEDELNNYDFTIIDLNQPTISSIRIMALSTDSRVLVISGEPNDKSVLYKSHIDEMFATLVVEKQVSMSKFKAIYDTGTKPYLELIETAQLILTKRLASLMSSDIFIDGFDNLIHKTISTFLYCGMSTDVLKTMQDKQKGSYEEKTECRYYMPIVIKQINIALNELEDEIVLYR